MKNGTSAKKRRRSNTPPDKRPGSARPVRAAKLSKSSAPDVVRDGLRKAIFDGDLVAGTQLRQDEIASRFGTSRIPVREALRQLESEGLVTLHPNRGAAVSSVSLEDVLELLEIRIGLECRALKLAIPNMVGSDFDFAAEILRGYDEEPEPQKWGEMNWRFHETLYAPCHRPKLLSMIEFELWPCWPLRPAASVDGGGQGAAQPRPLGHPRCLPRWRRQQGRQIARRAHRVYSKVAHGGYAQNVRSRFCGLALADTGMNAVTWRARRRWPMPAGESCSLW